MTKETYKLNSDATVAVATEVYWIPVDKDTPRGVKLQLLGQGGVAVYSEYRGESFWVSWQSVPARRP